MNLKIKKLHPNARMPEYATEGASILSRMANCPKPSEGMADSGALEHD